MEYIVPSLSIDTIIEMMYVNALEERLSQILQLEQGLTRPTTPMVGDTIYIE